MTWLMLHYRNPLLPPALALAYITLAAAFDALMMNLIFAPLGWQRVNVYWIVYWGFYFTTITVFILATMYLSCVSLTACNPIFCISTPLHWAADVAVLFWSGWEDTIYYWINPWEKFPAELPWLDQTWNLPSIIARLLSHKTVLASDLLAANMIGLAIVVAVAAAFLMTPITCKLQG